MNNAQRAFLALVLLVGLTVAARAQYVGGGSIGAAGGGGTFSGGALTSSLELDATNTTCAQALALAWTGDTNTGFQRSAADTIKVCIGGLDAMIFGAGVTQFADAAGTSRGRVTSTANADSYFHYSTSGGAVKVDAAHATVGSTGSIGDGSTAFAVAEGINIGSGGTTVLMRVYGGAVLATTSQAALAIASPTDTTGAPTAAGTACRIAAAGGVSAWTPAETNGVNGMFVCCTNTGTNAITVTDSDGVYEGPGSVLGQWDNVCMEYVTDRWVERSYSNNEP